MIENHTFLVLSGSLAVLLMGIAFLTMMTGLKWVRMLVGLIDLFLAQGWIGRCIILGGLAVFGYHGATKMSGGGTMLGMPHLGAFRPDSFTALPSYPQDGTPEGVTFPDYDAVITNPCLTGFLIGPTSVFLRAEWNFDYSLYNVTSLEVFAENNLLSNSWSYVGTAGFQRYDEKVTVEIPNGAMPDGSDNSMFFMFGLCIDQDGDGLTDTYEKLVTKTDPHVADTDGDGLPDGWEHENLFNPLSGQGCGEANADADGDGLSNIEEMALGTDPRSADGDGDGISDLDEIGYVEELRGEDFMWMDTTGFANLLGSSSTRDAMNSGLPIVPGVWVNGVCYTNAQVDMDGYVTLLNPIVQSSVSSGYRRPGSVTNYCWSSTHLTILAYEEDLYAKPRVNDWGSSVSAGRVVSGGRNYWVAEYKNMSHYDLRNEGPDDEILMNIQVIIPESETNVVYVSYQSVGTELQALAKVPWFGIQLPAMNRVPGRGTYANVSWIPSAGCFDTPLTLRYRLGTTTSPSRADEDGDELNDYEEIFTFHTSPFNSDTDGDGLEDSLEIAEGLNPLRQDTDGDGMPDGWEVEHGFDPLVDDSMLDADSDGLPNVAEHFSGTNPRKVDTDDDGLFDSREAAWIEDGTNMVPWFELEELKCITAGQNVDRGLYDCELTFTNTLAGQRISLAVADLNGVVYFGNDSTTNGLQSSNGGNNLTGNRNQECCLVAAYWSDLELRPTVGSEIRFGKSELEDVEWFVVEYDNVAVYGRNDYRVSFQVSLSTNFPDVVYVRYGQVVDGRTSGGKTIGAQGGWDGNRRNLPKLLYAYQTSPIALVDGQTLAFHFGCGGNPLIADTDGDGLSDYREVKFGTNPLKGDSDGDGMKDDVEIKYGLNPRSAVGVDGAEGDMDNDGIINLREISINTDPSNADSDEDGLADGQEVGYIVSGTSQSWLEFDAFRDVTECLAVPNTSYKCTNVELPEAIRVQGVLVTNVTLTSRGWVFLNRAGYANAGNSVGRSNFSYRIDKDTLALSPFGDGSLLVSTNLPDRATRVRVGTATEEGAGCVLIEYQNAYHGHPSSTTNSVSFQVSIPTNSPDRAIIRYRDIVGQAVDGRNTGIGMQSFDGRWMTTYCNGTQGMVYDGLELEFRFGANSDPLAADSDGDGVNDCREAELGTNLNSGDTDHDGLPDAWEVLYGLDPLRGEGEDGPLGDLDGDGLRNVDEYAAKTRPDAKDTDADGLTDLLEVGGVTTNMIEWLSFDSETNLTASFTSAYGSVVVWQLPEPIYLHGVCVLSLTIDSNGLVYFNKKGSTVPSSRSSKSAMTDWTLNESSFAVAAYWDALYLTPNAPLSTIRAGVGTAGTNRYCIVQYDGVCPYDNRMREGVTNSLSWQLSVPFGDAERIFVRYANQVGNTDGQSASVGYQDFEGRSKASYCYRERGMVASGMAFAFAVGTGTDPLSTDTDGDGDDDFSAYLEMVDSSTHDADEDGLIDSLELSAGTNPMHLDSDGDGMSDGWEVKYGFDPTIAANADGDEDEDGVSNLEESLYGSNPFTDDTDGDGLEDGMELNMGTDPCNPDTDGDGLNDGYEVDVGLDPTRLDSDGDGMSDGWEIENGMNPASSVGPDGASGDPDGDGVTNIDEYQFSTNPKDVDTDGDGVDDGTEISQGSDPVNENDGGIAPDPSSLRELEFNIYGDWAAWEMKIQGLGPQDTRTLKITMGGPDAPETKIHKLRKGNTYLLTMKWLNCDGHTDSRAPWYCWQAKIDGMPSEQSYPDYSNVRRSSNWVVSGEGWIAENADGLLTSHVHECTKMSDGSFGGGNVAGNLSATLYVLDDPVCAVDYARDGQIDDDDFHDAKEGRTAYFWQNNDTWKGNEAFTSDTSVNSANMKVDGRSDLVNFLPVAVDLRAFSGTWVRSHLKFSIEADTSSLRAAHFCLLPEAWTKSVSVAGDDLITTDGVEMHQSPVKALGAKYTLPDDFVSTAVRGSGIVAIEFPIETRNDSLRLVARRKDNDDEVCSFPLDLHIGNIDQMYGWCDVRSATGNQGAGVTTTATPDWPESERRAGNIVFVHGYNVSLNEARTWSRNVFKKLWWSGLDIGFVAATWLGNEGQISWIDSFAEFFDFGDWWDIGLITPDYQKNVENAFNSALALKNALDAFSGPRYMMAHSLGNMLVSAAAEDHGLQYAKYFMLNAAVPVEAYDPTGGVTENSRTVMTPLDWRSYPNMYRASHWCDLFTDARRQLTWKGRFAHVANTVNFYSSEEEVLKNGDGSNPGMGRELSWYYQEYSKGRKPNLLVVDMGRNEGGWRFNSQYDKVDHWEWDPALHGSVPVYRHSTVQDLVSDGVSAADLRNRPFFGPFVDMSICQQDDGDCTEILPSYRAQLLADAIPAESFAAGANAINISANQDLTALKNGIMLEKIYAKASDKDKKMKWRHSSFVTFPYSVSCELFNRIVNQTKQ